MREIWAMPSARDEPLGAVVGSRPPHRARRRSASTIVRAWGDASLTALLVVQCVTTFVAVPLSAAHPDSHTLLDVSRLIFAALCAIALTDRRPLRVALVAAILVLAAGPPLWNRAGATLGLDADDLHEIVSTVAFLFNALVTGLVAARTFGPGRVTAYRVQGAVLVYLNVAALCAIAFDILEMHAPGAITTSAGSVVAALPGGRTAELSYFSLSTITTAGLGDLIPVHPLARSLANLEAVFGQLFPAIFVARLVALHVAHTQRAPGDAGDPESPDALDATTPAVAGGGSSRS